MPDNDDNKVKKNYCNQCKYFKRESLMAGSYRTFDYICTNDESIYYAGFVKELDSCPDWKGKGHSK